MSHVDQIEFEEKWDLDTLKEMCEAEGWRFLEGRRTYEWFGTHVGDYPVPEGFSLAEMGKCDHAIDVGAKYQLGVVRKGGEWRLVWDFWKTGGLPEVLGPGAGVLKQSYSLAKVRRECRRRRLRFRERRNEGHREIEILMD